MEENKGADREILLFSMPEEVGALGRALKIFEVSIFTNTFRVVS